VNSPTALSWICPACARLVPGRVDTCRCGSTRGPETAAEPVPVAVKSASNSSILQWVVLAGVAAAAAGALVALQVTPQKSSATSSAPASTGAAAALKNAGGAPDLPAVPLEDPIASAGTLGEPPFAPDDPIVIAGNPSAPTSAPDGATVGRPITGSGSAEIPLEDVVTRSIPAIVSIEVGQGRGSGFFAAPGIVVTNRHVIQDKVSVTVRLSSGQALSGNVESSSAEFDLALIRVAGASPSQPVLELGTANDVRPGQEVIAIGLALGVFQNSVTRGIISAVRRTERTVLLQTDAAINPGNSGGPLLNRRGVVVGINTMKIEGKAESLGFAVAADHARGMLNGGHHPNMPITASASVSKPLAPAFSTSSSTDHAREEGTRRYDEIVNAIGRKAKELDAYWDRIKASCAVRAAPGYDHEWFGLWDRRATMTSTSSGCTSALADVDTAAGAIRDAMRQAEENARRASVLPGQLREIRRRHRMDWPGFD
jgi:S1-C subfamily serine protease